ncbi:hypothetical protein ACO34A_08350 [Rhizobium sp. ACO-34A]|nr:MarR family winged helix-turn-helix transcriptional regulator [Rhizobium sp. ACO-34A]ATN33820.1 hypothetical protein ACO34A_08350 [Rhizobium sp. ACO-34A]
MVRPEDAERLWECMRRMAPLFKVECRTMAGTPYSSLNLSDLSVVAFVGAYPGCIMGDVANELSSPLSTATTVVDRLVRKGLIERRRNEENRRTVRLQLTPMGQQLQDSITSAKRASCETVLEALKSDDRDTYIQLMEQIAENAQPLRRDAKIR